MLFQYSTKFNKTNIIIKLIKTIICFILMMNLLSFQCIEYTLYELNNLLLAFDGNHLTVSSLPATYYERNYFNLIQEKSNYNSD